jgi:hypothetical protein
MCSSVLVQSKSNLNRRCLQAHGYQYGTISAASLRRNDVGTRCLINRFTDIMRTSGRTNSVQDIAIFQTEMFNSDGSYQYWTSFYDYGDDQLPLPTARFAFIVYDFNAASGSLLEHTHELLRDLIDKLWLVGVENGPLAGRPEQQFRML